MPDPLSMPPLPNKGLKISMHPELKEKLEQAIDRAFEAKYTKEKEEAERAAKKD